MVSPGLAIVGWAIIDFEEGKEPSAVDYGAIITEKGLPVSTRLKEIYELFPLGPAKGACKIAGLPKPDGCV